MGFMEESSNSGLNKELSRAFGKRISVHMESKLTLGELYKNHREDVESQHGRIRSLIQDLVARAEIPERPEIERTFHALSQYLKLHFADEEQFMMTCAYPELSVHEAEHRRLSNDIDEAACCFLKDELDVQHFLPKLGARLEDHTVNTDQAYIDFCSHGLDRLLT